MTSRDHGAASHACAQAHAVDPAKETFELAGICPDDHGTVCRTSMLVRRPTGHPKSQIEGLRCYTIFTR